MDEAFFKRAYEADAAARSLASWSEYWGWVKTFYEGKRFPPIAGWAGRERDLLAKAPAARRDEVARALADTGRAIAAEWAKDNAVRKVSTDDLQRWGREFGDVAGDADRLLKALESVRAEIARRTGR